MFAVMSVAARGPRRILVVDDEPHLRELIAAALEILGVEVTQAQDGQDAFEILGRESFDLVVTDVRMPRMSGLELYQAVTRSGRLPPDRFLFITGCLELKAGLERRGAEGASHLFKPFQINDLLTLVTDMLEEFDTPSYRAHAA